MTLPRPRVGPGESDRKRGVAWNWKVWFIHEISVVTISIEQVYLVAALRHREHPIFGEVVLRAYRQWYNGSAAEAGPSVEV